MPPLYQVIDWNEHFENFRSRVVTKCQYVCVPTKHGGTGFCNVIAQPDGPAIYGVWVLLLQLLSRQAKRNGWLTQDGTKEGRRFSGEELARLWRRELAEVYRMLQVTTGEDVAWIRLVEGEHDWRQQGESIVAVSSEHRPRIVAVSSEHGTTEKEGKNAQNDTGYRPSIVGVSSEHALTQVFAAASFNGIDRVSSRYRRGIVRPTIERRKEGSTESDSKTVPTTTVLLSQNGEEEEGLQYAEAKLWLNNLFQNQMPWSYEEDHLLSELVPIPRAVQKLMDWAHRLPPEHPIHEMTFLRQKRVSLLRDFGGEADKIKKIRAQMGYDGAV